VLTCHLDQRRGDDELGDTGLTLLVGAHYHWSIQCVPDTLDWLDWVEHGGCPMGIRALVRGW
jgi:hypothetical protein